MTFELPPAPHCFSAEHEAFRATVRTFVQREIEPHVAGLRVAMAFGDTETRTAEALASARAPDRRRRARCAHLQGEEHGDAGDAVLRRPGGAAPRQPGRSVRRARDQTMKDLAARQLRL